jgi:DNA-binding NarL/FixJ family response regulator
MSAPKTKILIADDHQLICIALRKIFEECDDFEVIGDAADGEEAVKLAEKLKPDIVIMDISMPKMNGLEATRKIKAANPDILILVLTVHSDDEHIFGIIEAGADGYLTKSGLGEGIIHSVRDLITGKTVLSSSILKQLVERVLRHPVTPPPVVDSTLQGKITTREHEILVLAARGMTNKDIALKLNVSPLTIKNYFVDIFIKLGAHSRTDAVITGLKLGIIGLKDL